jgi:hypothetical protein
MVLSHFLLELARYNCFYGLMLVLFFYLGATFHWIELAVSLFASLLFFSCKRLLDKHMRISIHQWAIYIIYFLVLWLNGHIETTYGINLILLYFDEVILLGLCWMNILYLQRFFAGDYQH